MEVAILVFAIIGALLAIASGVWVAIALVRAISTHRAAPGEQSYAREKSNEQDA